MSWRTLARVTLACVVLAGIGLALWQRQRLGVATLGAWLGGGGAWAPLIFVTAYALLTMAFLPGTVLTLAGGALFGPWWGALYSLTGATAGATGAFLMARYVAGDWVRQRVRGRFERVLEGIEQEGWRFVAFVRLVPVFPFNLLNYALGLTRIPLPSYVAASYVFMLPGALVYAYLGYAGRTALGGGPGLARKALLALALLAVLVFLPRLVRRLRRGHLPPPPGRG